MYTVITTEHLLQCIQCIHSVMWWVILPVDMVDSVMIHTILEAEVTLRTVDYPCTRSASS